MIKWLVFPSVLLCLYACTKNKNIDVYSAGNLGGLTDVNSNLTNNITLRMYDTLCRQGKYCISDSLVYAAKEIDENYSNLTNRFYYFSNPPQEIYWVTMDGVNYLRKVFDFNKGLKGMWRSDFSASEVSRMKKRLLEGPLKEIESMARQYNFRTSEIYLDTTCLQVVQCN